MKRRSRLLFTAVALALVLSACGRNMHDTPATKPYEASRFFEDGAGMRTPPANTVSREFGNIDQGFMTGISSDGSIVSELPVELTPALIQRGQERYDIFCAVCHDYDGTGAGMAVQRGFPAPGSLHAAHLQAVPLGYFVQVMANGFGRMYPYDSRVPAGDRWAIAAYIKALQLSQNATADDLPEDLVLESLNPESATAGGDL